LPFRQLEPRLAAVFNHRLERYIRVLQLESAFLHPIDIQEVGDYGLQTATTTQHQRGEFFLFLVEHSHLLLLEHLQRADHEGQGGFHVVDQHVEDFVFLFLQDGRACVLNLEVRVGLAQFAGQTGHPEQEMHDEDDCPPHEQQREEELNPSSLAITFHQAGGRNPHADRATQIADRQALPAVSGDVRGACGVPVTGQATGLDIEPLDVNVGPFGLHRAELFSHPGITRHLLQNRSLDRIRQVGGHAGMQTDQSEPVVGGLVEERRNLAADFFRIESLELDVSVR